MIHLIGAGDRSRTGTIWKDRRILSPVRLPIPPLRRMALRVGLEPTTYRLTAGCSTIELPKNIQTGNVLLSQAVSHQVPSALKGLTSVFGMGTGVTPSLSSLDLFCIFKTTHSFWSSPRSISTCQLKTLLPLHLRPIIQIVFLGSYSNRMGNLILRGASRLDAFSAYHFQT